ncbi:MAG: hypothetical protein HZA90_22990 [Verrucomicrobia bacterium]|nr:hypothetical protein [Verrucomicrobiota bacterium]
MSTRLNRRAFVKAAVLTSAAVPLGAAAQQSTPVPVESRFSSPLPKPVESMPMGRIGSVEFSRLILGGNLISGYAHSRDLPYVAALSKRYNTEAKVLETFELAETHGINAMNSFVMDGNKELQLHWKRGGKMKWFAQVRIDSQGGFSQVKKAIDLGATAIHLTGDNADMLYKQGDIDKIGKMVDLIKSQKVIAGVAGHGLDAMRACVKANINVDFYQKTLHTHDYHTAPKPGETGDLGRYDNSWCKDPEEVVDFFFGVKKPLIAFKVMAAGAIPPRKAFQYAFDNGADFVLAGMFDWQVVEDVKIAKEVLANVKRTRPWCG